jgi:NAD(P)-dependent dehydrogenase (short-subunit alcohol dehydrogenase family)
MFDIKTEVVIITGVAGLLGANYARALLERGAKVIGLDIHHSARIEPLESQFGHAFQFISADVTKRESLLDVRVTVEKFGWVPTVLINNAAIDSPPSAPSTENGPFEEYPEESWDKVVDVNLKGVYLCCQVFGADMAKNGKGSIINVASIYGIVSPDQSLYNYRRERGEVFYKPVAYSASKSGIINLTRYLAVYWAKKGVRVNSLTIGGVFNHQEPAFIEEYCKRIPIGRMAGPDDYYGSLIFLSSQASKYMTGHNLVLDGGWTAI